MQALRRLSVWLVVAMALGLPRAADAQTFTLTVTAVLEDRTLGIVYIVEGGAGTLQWLQRRRNGHLRLPGSMRAPRFASRRRPERSAPAARAFLERLGTGGRVRAEHVLVHHDGRRRRHRHVFGRRGPASTITTTVNGDGPGRVATGGEFCERLPAESTKMCSFVYLTGSTISIEAEAAPGARFAGYSGTTGPAAACGAQPRCDMVLDADAAATATFRQHDVVHGVTVGRRRNRRRSADALSGDRHVHRRRDRTDSSPAGGVA
jgi:hypothetical protein